MSVRKRTVQRTPDLGIKIRMVKEVAPVVESDCCEPEIGLARWYNPATGDYELETVVGHWEDSISGGQGHDFLVVDGVVTALFVAEVAGDLCDCTVEWDVTWVPT